MATARKSNTVRNARREGTPPAIPSTGKFIWYSAADRDYLGYLDGCFISVYRNYSEAEEELDRLVAEQLQRHPAPSALDEAALVAGAVVDLAEYAENKAASEAERRAIRKAAYHAATGVQAVRSGHGYLVPSATTGGTVYRTDGQECTCEASLHGRYCWHAQLARLVGRVAEVVTC